MSFFKALRYFVANPRYTVLYRRGNSAGVLQASTGEPSTRYETLHGELLKCHQEGLKHAPVITP
jgi:hypothetical protein